MSAAFMRRIGVFGGTFDPVQVAHVELARAALDQLALDELRWVPAGQPWQKPQNLTPAAHRVAMVDMVIDGEPRFMLDRCEIDRSGPSYTLDTVRELQAATPGAQLFLVIGQDQYARLHTWHGFEELLARVTLAVANRPDSPLTADERVRRAERNSVALPMLPISSTAVRDAVAEGRTIDRLVPVSVARYIEEHRLYRGPRS